MTFAAPRAPFAVRSLLALLGLGVGLAVSSGARASEGHGATPAAAAPAPKPAVTAQTEPAPAPAEKEGRTVTLKTSVDPLEDPMERLRRRLAERLNAEATKPNPNVVKVVNKPEGGDDATVTLRSDARPKPAAPRPAKPKPAAKPAAMPSATAAALAAEAQASNAALLWGYEGATGPDHWAQLKPEYAACGNGKRQSPIDIRDNIGVQLDPVQFDYKPSTFSVVDNGHTVQVDVAAGNFIEVMGRRYELQEFHFHRPSEERLNGQQFDMVAHLTHKDAEGRIAVVAVLLDRGSPQPVVQAVWNNLPLEKGDTLTARTPLDLNGLLPADRSYYTYMGSLSTPPCSEGVLWMVMKQPVGIAPDQIGVFARLYPMNARPVQAVAGRLIKGPK